MKQVILLYIWFSAVLCGGELEDLLEKYTRPFTVLFIALGENEDLFRLTQKYRDSVFVFFESDPEALLFNARGENVLVLNNACDKAVFQTLNGHDHFDVIYSAKENRSLESLCDHLFLLQEEGLRYTVGSGKEIEKDVIGAPFAKKYRLKSTFSRKELYKRTETVKNWKPGINLCSFIYFNGVYPTREEILKKYQEIDLTSLRDPFIWNIVIQGSKLQFIDQKEYKAFSVDYYYLNQLTETLLFCTPSEYRELLGMDNGDFENSFFRITRSKATVRRR